MDKTERLLDLIALFLDTREPLSWSELRDIFPHDYGQGTREACERKFERDKADLADLGIVLQFKPDTDESKEGYLLAREDYYLPRIAFDPEELAVLYAAGSAALASGAFPGRVDLAHALRKIAFASPADREPAVEPSGFPSLFVDHGREAGPRRDELGEHLEKLWQALLARKRVHLVYRGVGRDEETRRTVDPYGLCLRRGAWVLVGWCHLRKAERTFHVERVVSLEVNQERPRTPDYDVPAGFSIDRVAREQVWEHRFHEPVEVALELSRELAPLAGRLFPGSPVSPRKDGVAVTVRATYLDALLRRVLSLGDGARLAGPPSAVRRLREMVGALERGHRGAPSKEVA